MPPVLIERPCCWGGEALITSCAKRAWSGRAARLALSGAGNCSPRAFVCSQKFFPDNANAEDFRITCVAIIPARGGSKRIPFKNGRAFHGKPMMSWPIATARDSGLFSRIVVSTDDAELAECARLSGAQVPFVRAAGLADDHTGTTEVIRDAIARLELAPDVLVCCIYPTAAFATSEDLRQAHQKLVSGNANWVLTVGEFPAPVDRGYRRTSSGFVPRWPENMPARSQDLEPMYFDAGQFYWASVATWMQPGAHVWDGADAVVLPRERCVDIDTEDDWALAESLFSLQRGKRGI